MAKKLINFWDEFGEIIGDAFLIAFGILLIYIFVTIEIYHIYGVEPNAIIRRVEEFMGLPIIILGINRLIKDIRRV